MTRTRTHVVFHHPAPFIEYTQEDPILSTQGVDWFVDMLKTIPGLTDVSLCQEDWGVVIRVERNRKKFWIGLSFWEGEPTWIAHLHHETLNWIQRLSSSGQHEFRQLALELHHALSRTPSFSIIAWYPEKEIVYGPIGQGSTTPV